MNQSVTTVSPKTPEIKKIFSEAWEKNKGFKGSFWAAFLIFMLITIIVYAIAYDISVMIEGPPNSAEKAGQLAPVWEFSKLILSIFVITPLGAGLWALCVKRSVLAPITYTELFRYFSYWKTLWGYPVLFGVLNLLSILLLFIPFLGLAISLLTLFATIVFIFYIPLAIDKNLKPQQSFLGSWQAVKPNLLTFIGFWLLVFGISILSALTLGIALIWTLPWIYCAMGILYRDTCGVSTLNTK